MLRASSLGDEKERAKETGKPGQGCLNSLINKMFMKKEEGSDQLCQMLLMGQVHAVADG